MKAERLRIVVADDERTTREYLEDVLPRLGYEVVAAAVNGRTLIERTRAAHPDLVIADVKMPDMDGIEAAHAISREMSIPIILLSGHHDDDLIGRLKKSPTGLDYDATNVMTYLVKPVTEADLKTAIPLAVGRFRQMRELADEAASLRQALEDRKVIERAKGILMKRLRLEEADAFRRIRILASSQNRKLIEVCRQIVSVDEIFTQLESITPREGGE